MPNEKQRRKTSARSRTTTFLVFPRNAHCSRSWERGKKGGERAGGAGTVGRLRKWLSNKSQSKTALKVSQRQRRGRRRRKRRRRRLVANAFDRPVESIISSYSPSPPLLSSVKKVTMLVVVAAAAVWGPQLICQIMSRQRGGSSNQREGANEAAFVKQLPALGAGQRRIKNSRAGEENEPGRATQLCVVRPKKKQKQKGFAFCKKCVQSPKAKQLWSSNNNNNRKRTTTTRAGTATTGTTTTTTSTTTTSWTTTTIMMRLQVFFCLVVLPFVAAASQLLLLLLLPLLLWAILCHFLCPFLCRFSPFCFHNLWLIAAFAC